MAGNPEEEHRADLLMKSEEAAGCRGSDGGSRLAVGRNPKGNRLRENLILICNSSKTKKKTQNRITTSNQPRN